MMYPAWMGETGATQVVRAVQIFERLNVDTLKYEPVTLETKAEELEIDAAFRVIGVDVT